MASTRRSLLLAGLLLGCPGVGGCLAGGDDGGDGELPRTAELRLEATSFAETEGEPTDPIAFAELSGPERAIVREAVERGSYTERIGDTSEGLDRLRSRIETRTRDDVEAYLRRDDTYYRVGFVAGDHVVAATDDTPDDTNG